MKIRLSLWMVLLASVIQSAGCALPEYNLPPAERLRAPGPGVGGPGPAIMPPMMPSLPPGMQPMNRPDVQVLFSRPEGMQVRWDVTGGGNFDSIPLIVPGRRNFPQGAIYRLKLTNIDGREGVELYPTVEIGPTTPRTEAYLAHNAIPAQFTAEDFDQVMAGNFVTKVIYLPDPEFQQLALSGVETIVSTRLDPGVDPVVEADRRGAIMAVIRLGNKDVEMPGATDNSSVMPVTYNQASQPTEAAPMQSMGGASPMMMGPYPMGPAMGGPTGRPPNYVAGVTAPPWGMPITSTPIGLPGPPHIPHGIPAGLQKHVIRNHTKMHIPQPTSKLRIDVRQQPGFSYPQPPNRMRITEQNIRPSLPFHQPPWNKHQRVQ